MKLSQLRQMIREEAKRALNEGPLVKATRASEDLRDSVVELENYLMTIGKKKNINWDWSELVYLIIAIINDAKQEARDEYKD